MHGGYLHFWWELIPDRRIFFCAPIDLAALRIYHGSVFAQRGWAPTGLCTLRHLAVRVDLRSPIGVSFFARRSIWRLCVSIMALHSPNGVGLAPGFALCGGLGVGADPRSANLFLRDDRSGGFAYLLWLCIRPTGLGSHQALHSAGACVWETIFD